MINKKWLIKEPDKAAQDILTRELNISLAASQVLINRGIREVEAAQRFLSPSLSHLHSPLMMKDMEKAVERIIKGISANEKITIYGDYDVDGITALSILKIFLHEVNADVSFYIPDRLSEGYGLNHEAVKKIKDLGTGLMISVDCGISDIQEVGLAQKNGIDVIITDHHEVPDESPPAFAILNPKQKGCCFPFKSLAGVGVVFNLIIALRASLRDQGFWKHDKIPNLGEYLDLVALGTIADIVPLRDENRIFVKFGLEQLTNSSRPGVIALKEVSGLEDSTINPGMVGFRLAPRINAGGRVGKADHGVRLLTTKDLGEAKKMAAFLDGANKERQQIEEHMVIEAKKAVQGNEDMLNSRSIVLASPDWHPGVIGIAASRLVDAYYRPAVMIALQGGIGKGSGRSIEGFDLYKGLRESAYLLDGFGGHMYAAGITIEENKIPEFQAVFEKIVKESLSDEDLIPKIHIDARIPLKGLTMELLRDLDILSPFGPSNPEPVFCSSILSVAHSGIVGNGHLKLKVKENGAIYDAIGFNMGEKVVSAKERIRAAFVPQINNWQGRRTIQLKLKDVQVMPNKS